jgi:hypothetical protein
MKTLEHIVGEDHDAARLPLSQILSNYFDLNIDCWMDESGIKKFRFVDTQGFIASCQDDSTIVLSYRFSTTLYDWATNINMTSSEWELDVDEKLGHAGFCSCLDGLFTKYCTSRGKPRVHTGFYNNFIYTIPYIRKHILDKLLPKDGNNQAKPIKVYICGASLGAAIATLAYVFVLQELFPYLRDPTRPNHKIICVTAGCPRVGDKRFCSMVHDMVKELRPMDRTVNARMVYNQDLVPHIPFHVMRFAHLDKLVFITENGEHVIINPNLKILKYKSFREVTEVFKSFYREKKKEANKLAKDTQNGAIKVAKDTQQGAEKLAKETQQGAIRVVQETRQLLTGEDDVDVKLSPLTPTTPPTETETDRAFAKECSTTPAPIKDHMPHWYLEALEKLKEKEDVIQLAETDDAQEAGLDRIEKHLTSEHLPMAEEC